MNIYEVVRDDGDSSVGLGHSYSYYGQDGNGQWWEVSSDPKSIWKEPVHWPRALEDVAAIASGKRTGDIVAIRQLPPQATATPYPQYWLVEASVNERLYPGSGWRFYCYQHAWSISPAKRAGFEMHYPEAPRDIKVGDQVQVATFDCSDPWGRVVEVTTDGVDVQVPGWSTLAFFTWRGVLAHKPA